MIELEEATLQLGTQILFRDVSLSIFPGQKIGVIGRNGSGKSSLFRLIEGQHSLEHGYCRVPKQWVIASVAQETNDLDSSAIDYVLAGDAELVALRKALVIAEQENDAHKIGSINQKLEDIHAYSANARASTLLSGLGFKPEENTQAVGLFSGGWQMRLNLARALMCRSDVLLLDEPTNHLDLETVLWLENWLKLYKGTLLIISHDRYFLDNTVQQILHVGHGQIASYTGNYTQFERSKAMQDNLQAAKNRKIEQKKAHLSAFIDRFKAKASKAKQAQSRIKTLEKMEQAIQVQEEAGFEFEFLTPDSLPSHYLSLENASVGYNDKALLSDINFSLEPDDRIGLLGPNGAGKTTFLRTLAGQLQPISGELNRSKHFKLGYYSQQLLETLDKELSPIDHLQQLAGDTREQELRNYLGGFGFSGDKIFADVGHFSGGEKARLSLALIVWQKPNVLLLDEPTNHLDMEMRSALSLALQSFAGPVVAISHDRYFLDAVCDQFYEIRQGKVMTYQGDLNDYQAGLKREETEEASKTTEELVKNNSKKDQRRQEAKIRQALSPLKKQIQNLEKKLEKLSAEHDSITQKLADPSIYEAENKSALQQLLIDDKKVLQEKNTVEEEWLNLEHELDQLQQELRSDDE